MNPDEELFCSIYKRLMPLLRVLAKQYGVPYDEIDDVIQDTFLSFYIHYPMTWEDYKIKAMLCKILRNRCVDYSRRKDSHPVSYCDPIQMQTEIDIMSRLISRDNLTVLIEQQDYREVWEALKSMKEEWAQVFYLYVIQERPMEEVSKILGITDAACRTRLTRGRKYLREKLKKDRSEPEES